MDRTQADIQSVIAHKELFAALNGSTILVAGATGMIGSMMVKTLLSANEFYGLNIEVVGQIRDFKKAEMVFGDLTEKLHLTTHNDIACDHIVHTISPTKSKYFIEHPVETIRTAVDSTVSALESARKNHADIVYLSSMEQYGVPYMPGELVAEDYIGRIDHLNIRSSYSESKRLCECLCASYAAEYAVDIKIARLAQTFGAGVPMTDNRMPMQFARAAVAGRDIVLHTEGKSLSNFVYLSDALTGILTIMTGGTAGEAYNVCNDKETRSVYEIAKLVAKEIAQGCIEVKVEIPSENMGFAPDTAMYLNSDKLKRLGWNAEVGMVEAYRRLTEYLHEMQCQ